MRRLLLFLTLVTLISGVLAAQTKTDPSTQINWTKTVGSQIHGVTNGTAAQDVVTKSQLEAMMRASSEAYVYKENGYTVARDKNGTVIDRKISDATNDSIVSQAALNVTGGKISFSADFFYGMHLIVDDWRAIEGQGANTIFVKTDAEDCIEAIGANWAVSNLRIYGNNNQTQHNYAINATGPYYLIQDVDIWYGNSGIKVVGVAGWINRVRIMDLADFTNYDGVGVDIAGGTDRWFTDVLVSNKVFEPDQLAVGLRLLHQNGDYFTKFETIGGLYSVLFDPALGDDTGGCYFDNCVFDTARSVGILYAGAGFMGGNSFSDTHIGNAASHGVSDGLVTGNLTDATFQNCHVYNCGESGFLLTKGKKTKIQNCQIGDNNIADNAAEQSACGIFADELIGFQATGNTINNSMFGYLNGYQDYGISANNLTDSLISDNIVTGNLVLGIKYPAWTWLGTGTRVVDNIGFNPTNPDDPTVPSSTVAYTNNFGFPCTVNVIGGTVSVIAVNGKTTGLTAGMVTVPACGTITLTYSSAPTWVWIGM